MSSKSLSTDLKISENSLCLNSWTETPMVEKLYDLSFLKDYFNDDVSLIRHFLEMYLEETPKEMAKIEESLDRNDLAGAKAGTHKMKANVAMLGIRDGSTFINDMHLMNPMQSVSDDNRKQFEQFKADVVSGLLQIRKDFFE